MKGPDPIEEFSKLKPGEIYEPRALVNRQELEALRDEYYYLYRKCRPNNRAMWMKKYLNIVYQIEFMEALAPNDQ